MRRGHMSTSPVLECKGMMAANRCRCALSRTCSGTRQKDGSYRVHTDIYNWSLLPGEL